MIKWLEIQNELAAGVELLGSRIKNICLQIFEEAYDSVLRRNIGKYTFFVNMLFIEVWFDGFIEYEANFVKNLITFGKMFNFRADLI